MPQVRFRSLSRPSAIRGPPLDCTPPRWSATYIDWVAVTPPGFRLFFFAENQIQRPCKIFSGRWGIFLHRLFSVFFLFYSMLEKKKKATTGHVTSAGLLRASLGWQSRLPVQSSLKLAHLPTLTALTQEAQPTGQASIAQRPALCCLDFVIEHRQKENPRLDGTNLGQKQPLMAQNLECAPLTPPLAAGLPLALRTLSRKPTQLQTLVRHLACTLAERKARVKEKRGAKGKKEIPPVPSCSETSRPQPPGGGGGGQLPPFLRLPCAGEPWQRKKRQAPGGCSSGQGVVD